MENIKLKKPDDKALKTLGTLIVGIATSSVVIYFLSQLIKNARKEKK